MTQSETTIREGDLCVMNSVRADNVVVLALKQVAIDYDGARWIRVLKPDGVLDWAAQSGLHPVQRAR